MILDYKKGLGGQPSHYDICIVGAGPAGISLAPTLFDTMGA